MTVELVARGVVGAGLLAARHGNGAVQAWADLVFASD
jgi:hypothetical protein